MKFNPFVTYTKEYEAGLLKTKSLFNRNCLP